VARPSGIVTFLVTGIEGSTRRWEPDPEAMRAALAAHDELLASLVEAHGAVRYAREQILLARRELGSSGVGAAWASR
jgi:hypothetical protein